MVNSFFQSSYQTMLTFSKSYGHSPTKLDFLKSIPNNNDTFRKLIPNTRYNFLKVPGSEAIFGEIRQDTNLYTKIFVY